MKNKTNSEGGQDISEQGTPKSRHSSKRKRIFLVGDSILNGINENGPGDSSKDLVDHVKPIVRKKPYLILVHFGTNDVTNGINMEEEMQKAIDHMRKESPETDIVISLCTRRKDKPCLNNKLNKCSETLREICV